MADGRPERLKAALRENLKRRKAQIRERETAAGARNGAPAVDPARQADPESDKGES